MVYGFALGLGFTCGSAFASGFFLCLWLCHDAYEKENVAADARFLRVVILFFLHGDKILPFAPNFFFSFFFFFFLFFFLSFSFPFADFRVENRYFMLALSFFIQHLHE